MNFKFLQYKLKDMKINNIYFFDDFDLSILEEELFFSKY